MLEELEIHDLGPIHRALLTPAGGMTAITGETGAGKSIVIDAISAVLGERTSRELIRTGARSALVTAVFTGVPPLAWLVENGFSTGREELLLQRELQGDGRNVCRVDGRLVTVAQLRELGRQEKPVLLKRGLSNTYEEWIMSAEYIMAGGNEQVILCERGIRTFEKYTRNTLDLSAVPIIHEKTHLPIIVDPSHATGKANLVEPMMIAAVAAGADGLEVEVHYDPQHAWSDGAQCLTPDSFAQAMAKCRQVAWAIGRDM